MSGTPRMRTLPQALAEIKKIDPESAVTLTALRNLVKRGVIPTVQVSSKRLVNLDVLFAALNPTPTESKQEALSGHIRPLPERLGNYHG